METSIDYVVVVVVVVDVDIEGHPINLPEKNGSSNFVSLPGAFMRSGDVKVYHMTNVGQRAYERSTFSANGKGETLLRGRYNPL